MNDNAYVVKTICEVLAGGSSLALASIVGIQGSSPRHLGAKMVIAADGRKFGTVGGSLLEGNVIKSAPAIIGSQHSRILEFDLTSRDVHSREMICGGRAVVLLDYIAATPENLSFFRRFDSLIETGQEFIFVTLLKDAGQDLLDATRSLLLANGEAVGNAELSCEDIKFIRDLARDSNAVSEAQLGKTRVIVEPVTRTKTLFIFGAGHVGKATAHLAAWVGFKIIVSDDRAEFASEERFPDASKLCVIDYNDAFKGLEIDRDSYIIILTRGHAFDRVVLKQSLRKGAGYIGMIGSRPKRDAIYAALLSEGFGREELEKVHSPIGLAIGAESPEEIAVSIVAELVKMRSRKTA